MYWSLLDGVSIYDAVCKGTYVLYSMMVCDDILVTTCKEKVVVRLCCVTALDTVRLQKYMSPHMCDSKKKKLFSTVVALRAHQHKNVFLPFVGPFQSNVYCSVCRHPLLVNTTIDCCRTFACEWRIRFYVCPTNVALEKEKRKQHGNVVAHVYGMCLGRDIPKFFPSRMATSRRKPSLFVLHDRTQVVCVWYLSSWVYDRRRTGDPQGMFPSTPRSHVFPVSTKSHCGPKKDSGPSNHEPRLQSTTSRERCSHWFTSCKVRPWAVQGQIAPIAAAGIIPWTRHGDGQREGQGRWRRSTVLGNLSQMSCWLAYVFVHDHAWQWLSETCHGRRHRHGCRRRSCADDIDFQTKCRVGKECLVGHVSLYLQPPGSIRNCVCMAVKKRKRVWTTRGCVHFPVQKESLFPREAGRPHLLQTQLLVSYHHYPCTIEKEWTMKIMRTPMLCFLKVGVVTSGYEKKRQTLPSPTNHVVNCRSSALILIKDPRMIFTSTGFFFGCQFR